MSVNNKPEILDLSDQYKDEEKLAARKQVHRIYSINELDMQEEAIYRVGKASSVLDIGCGVGEILIKLRSSGFKGRLKGVDKYDIIKKGIKLSRDNNLNIEFEQLDLAVQISTGIWDVGIMVSILCFLPEYKDVIRNYSKICRKVILVDTGYPEAYPWLNRFLPRELERVFNVRAKTLRIGFTISSAICELMKYYETINIQKLDDSFRFTDTDSVMEYVCTNSPGGWTPEPSEKMWKAMLNYARLLAEKKLKVDKVWIEPKPYYVVVAENHI